MLILSNANAKQYYDNAMLMLMLSNANANQCYC